MTPTQRAICQAGAELFGLSAKKAAAVLERGNNPAEALLNAGLLTEDQLDRVLEEAYGRVRAEGDRLVPGASDDAQREGNGGEQLAPPPDHVPGLRALLDRLRDIVSGDVEVALPVVEVVREVAVPAPFPPPRARREPTPPAPVSRPQTAEPIAPRPRTVEPVPPAERIEAEPQTIDFVMGVDPSQDLEDGPTIVAEKKPEITDREAQERLAEAAFDAWARHKGISPDTLAAARASGDHLAQALVDMGRLEREDAAAALEGDEHLRCQACGAEFSLSPMLLSFGRREPCPRCNNELASVSPDATVSIPISATGIPAYAGTTPPKYTPDIDDEARTLAKASDRLPRTHANSTSPNLVVGGMSNYEILGELARGGMGIVYKARQKGLGRIVCLKVMRGAALASPDDRRRFLREAEASARLNHPGIVPVHEVGEHDGQCFFSMDFIEGDELGRWAKKEKPEIRDLVTIMVDVCEAIHYAHLRGIIHRDLKPANVMIDQQQKPHVMDFGIAKRLDASDDSKRGGPLTQEGEIMGTPHYMAPEQAEGKVSEVDVRSDVYALGVICYELFTGKRPFQDENILRLIKLVVHAEPTSLRVVRPDIDMDLETIVLKAMDKEKARRYQSALDLRLELKRWLDGEAIEARRASNWYRLKKWARRNQGFATAIAIFASLLFLVIGLFITKLIGDSVRHKRAVSQLIERGQLDQQTGRLREAFTSFGEAVYMDRGNQVARDGYVDTGLQIADGLLAENTPGRAEEILNQLRFVEGRAEDVDAALAKAGVLRRKAVEIGVARQRKFIDATRSTLKALDGLPEDHVLRGEEARDYVVTLVRHQDPETIKLMRARLMAEGDRTRQIVARALGWIAAPAAVPELVALLASEEGLAVEAADALGQIGGQQAWDALRAARKKRGLSFSDRTQPALRRIARSLETVSEAVILEANPELKKLEPSDPQRIREVRIRRLFLSADRLRLAGDHQAAAAAYGQALLLAPEAVEGHLGRGLSLMALGRLREAEDDLERVVRAEGPTLGSALLNRAEVRRRRGKEKGALADLGALLRAAPGRADAHLARARIHLAAERLQNAHEDLDTALRLRGDYADAIASRAQAHLLEAKLDEALSDAERALELRPGHPEFLLVRAQVRLARGDLAESRGDAAQAASLRPRLVEAYRLQASGWQRAGQVDEALSALDAGLEATGEPSLRLERALVLLEANRPRDAVLALEPLLGNPRTPDGLRLEALSQRGVARMRLGEPRAALPDLRRVVAGAPQSAAAHYNLACALAQTGDLTEALRVLEQAVALGFPPGELKADPDLRPLHGQEPFERLAKTKEQ